MKILQIGIPALTFSLMWLVLSGRFDAFHLSVGALSVVVVVMAAWRLSIFPKDRIGEDIWSSVYRNVRWRYGIWYPWILLYNITSANLKVAALILAPHMPIDPFLLRFKARYATDVAKILLGNSITLTPGTVTLEIEQDEFTVHALSPHLADSLLDGTDQNRIARIFGDPEGTDFSINISRTMEPA